MEQRRNSKHIQEPFFLNPRFFQDFINRLLSYNLCLQSYKTTSMQSLSLRNNIVSMNAQLTEIMRLITNLIRTGVVTEVDRENWLCRVKTGDLETNWISWLTLRAGNARTWWRPSKGEQVVLLSLGGNLETAFALPAVYSNQFAPPSTSADACVTEHPDGGWFEYEPATGRWYVRGIKSMVIEAADNITMKTSEFVLEADRTRINSEVVINGGVTQGGGAMSSNGIVVDAHQHTGVLKGGDTTGGPV